MRHGIAEEASGTGQDCDRELTGEGVEKTEAAGRGLREMGVKIDVLLSSPYARAWSTAEIIAKALGAAAKLKRCEALSSGRSAGEQLAEIGKMARPLAALLLVGHEPDLSRLISILLSGREGLPVMMKKGALCKLSCARVEPGAAQLDWLMTARQLGRMG